MRKSSVWNPKASHRPLPILRAEHQKCTEEQITKKLTRPHLYLYFNLKKGPLSLVEGVVRHQNTGFSVEHKPSQALYQFVNT